MLAKESKIRVLENFYGLDYLFFGKPTDKVKGGCCPALMEEYVTAKGALLSIMIEMFKLVNHKPQSLTEKMDSAKIRESARESAKIARENCEKLVSSIKGRKAVKEEISKIIEEHQVKDVDNLVKETIRSKAFNLAVDNLLVARTITESEDYKNLNEWEGKLLEEAYKTLREDLVETAIMILDSKTEK